MSIKDKLACFIHGHHWKFDNDVIDGMTGNRFGKHYKCSRCNEIVHVAVGRSIKDF